MREERPKFKVSLVGNAGVGKSSFIHRHLWGEMIKEHVPTVNHNVRTLAFVTSQGSVEHDIWDISGSHSMPEDRMEWLKGSDAALIMFDFSRKKTLEDAIAWYCELVAVNSPDIPIVICGNKVDLDETDREVQSEMIKWPREMDRVRYYDLSTETCHNLEEPFLCLMRQLCHDPNLEFVFSGCRLRPPSPQTEEERLEMERIRQEMDWNALPLPDDDELDL